MPLLRVDPANSEAMSEVPVEIRIFLWRRLRASGRAIAQRISRRENRAARSRYGANQAAIPGNARRVRRWRARYFGRHANAREGPRFSARNAGRRDQRGFLAELAGFSRCRAHVSVADASCGSRRSWGIAGARADPNFLSGALRDSGRG